MLWFERQMQTSTWKMSESGIQQACKVGSPRQAVVSLPSGTCEWTVPRMLAEGTADVARFHACLVLVDSLPAATIPQLISAKPCFVCLQRRRHMCGSMQSRAATRLCARGSDNWRTPSWHGIEELASSVAACAGAHDHRALAVQYDFAGDRSRGCKAAVVKLTESEFPDWPVKGPRRTLAGSGHGKLITTPLQQHRCWRTILRLGERQLEWTTTGRSLLETGSMYDQLNILEIACVEVLARRIQLEERYGLRPKDTHSDAKSNNRSFDGLALFSGEEEGLGAALVLPSRGKVHE